MSAMKNIRLAAVVFAAAAVAFSAIAEDAAAKPNAGAADAAKDEAAKKEGGAEKGKKGEQENQYKPIAEARAQIGDVISDPAKMAEVMKELSPDDQKTFVADVNAAISKLPGSTEDKTAKYLNVNRAALKGASAGNMASILAVTFATVPPESLMVLSERYANDLFNRDADPSQKISDAAYENTAREVIGKVVQATSGSDDAGVRNTLAVLMFVRASNESIDGLADRLVETIPDATVRELAKKEWIPAAMAEGEKKSYDAMLAYADAGKAPNIEMVISLAGPQILDAMLIDITSGMDNSLGIQTTPVLDQAFGGFDEARVNFAELNDTKSTAATVNGGNEVPRTANPLAPWNPEYNRGSIDKTKAVIEKVVEAIIREQSDPEPQPYPYSSL